MKEADGDSALDRATEEALALFADQRRGTRSRAGAEDWFPDEGAQEPGRSGAGGAEPRRAGPAHDGQAPLAYFPFDEMPVGGGVVDGGRAMGTARAAQATRGPSVPAPAPAPAYDDFPFTGIDDTGIDDTDDTGVVQNGKDRKRARDMTADDTPHAPHASHGAAPWPAARAVAAEAADALPAEDRALGDALGQVLAESLVALTDLPSFDTSAMDGWAVSGPGPWKLPPPGAQDVLAGRPGARPLRDGSAVRIATGAPVPPGATAVLRSEHGEVTVKGELLAARHVSHGQDIRPRGGECRQGDELVPAGTLVTPALLGLAAAAGYDDLTVVRRPRVEVLVLGDELLREGLPEGGLIRDALGPMLGPWLRALGAEPGEALCLGDDEDALYEGLAASTADVVVTTGGTAFGPVDHVHPTLRRLGAELLVDGVAVRPGHPMLLARLGPGRHVVGLPGNPLAAVAGLLTLAEPLLRGLTGRVPGEPVRAVLAESVSGHPADTRLVPVSYDGAGCVRPLRFHGPAMLRGLAAADGMAVVPAGGAGRAAEVQVLGLP
ncbi:molybdopterin molybdenumtransferase MoeA [Streptomyces sp. NRRL B-1677]|uniref:molybdopterin molybdotransferase MoeA n=1 Tax=Streptomyces sp. NRRL B-1677 TaxID=2682966 RepID=UPI001892CB97|nr:molybdopterin molybdotransferase MoeA [Streptomyces sp. NRRL B-1677]MBF6046115.1 molybdopterin molybdenumtransferase MoeA [Streptomyces sp. NRRL B-1677]